MRIRKSCLTKASTGSMAVLQFSAAWCDGLKNYCTMTNGKGSIVFVSKLGVSNYTYGLRFDCSVWDYHLRQYD
jgi:hypothetical protein